MMTAIRASRAKAKCRSMWTPTRRDNTRLRKKFHEPSALYGRGGGKALISKSAGCREREFPFLLAATAESAKESILTVLPGMLFGALSASLALVLGSSLLMTLVAYSLVASTITIAIGVAIFFPSRPLN